VILGRDTTACIRRRTISRLAIACALAFVAAACLTERNLDRPPPGLEKPEAPHLVVRRTKGRQGKLVHEWTVLVQAGHDEVRQGRDLTWYPSGAKEWERAFDHDQPKGTWRKWYENGQQASETTFAGAEVEVPMRFWHANGQLSAEGQAKNGSRCGTWRFWNEQGTLREEGTYAGSLREGSWKVWDAPGAEPRVVTYVHNVIAPGQ
jgi:antitoxin component YwqK of YwqJK toxin-antitoxin module